MNLDRLRDLLAAEDPAWAIQGVELLRTLPASIWVPMIADLEEIRSGSPVGVG